ncbi:MAG: hypothetical protein DBP02_19830 [gamma proteobacterium symbiont of Ctena orbiculata]|nr:MAG: hypothetical protein DBP02_19830 [gamma proteobacterium symbiont of Ctena orbiculata]
MAPGTEATGMNHEVLDLMPVLFLWIFPGTTVREMAVLTLNQHAWIVNGDLAAGDNLRIRNRVRHDLAGNRVDSGNAGILKVVLRAEPYVFLSECRGIGVLRMAFKALARAVGSTKMTVKYCMFVHGLDDKLRFRAITYTAGNVDRLSWGQIEGHGGEGEK